MSNSRAYLYVEHSTGKSNPVPIDLRGRTLRFTIDVSHVPCGCIAALYFVAMRAPADKQWASYCDILSTPSCVEIDILESNVATVQTTIHTTTEEEYSAEHCNAWGCNVK